MSDNGYAGLPVIGLLPWPWNAVVFFFLLIGVSFLSSWIFDRFGWKGYTVWLTATAVVCAVVYVWT